MEIRSNRSIKPLMIILYFFSSKSIRKKGKLNKAKIMICLFRVKLGKHIDNRKNKYKNKFFLLMKGFWKKYIKGAKEKGLKNKLTAMGIPYLSNAREIMYKYNRFNM